VSHRFIPNSSSDKIEILKSCGVNSFEDLIQGIPSELQFNGDLGNGPGLSELEIRRKISTLTKNSKAKTGAISFAGAGVYEHTCPAVVNQLTLRGEFLTSYTPYQPEMTQGTLQSLFEFQTMVAELFGMEISNASHYDGSTAFAEAALMSMRLQKEKNTILVSEGVHPEYIEVLQCYLKNLGMHIKLIPLNVLGETCVDSAKSLFDKNCACIMIQSPNFFGVIEPQEKFAELSKSHESLFVSSVTEPLSLGVLKPPGEFGADIATGEGQSFGIAPSFGGPYLGLFTSSLQNVRQMPGRLCGETVDALGRRSYCLTLSTREQHIRRDKATSNICTNQNLFGLWASIWLAMVGKEGFVQLAEQNVAKTEYAKQALLSTDKVLLRYSKSLTFNEFTIDFKNKPALDVYQKCVAHGVAPGVLLEKFSKLHSEKYFNKTGLLLNFTEMKSKAEIDELVSLIQKYG
jgi:glycine dehydrogenase subunit 1